MVMMMKKTLLTLMLSTFALVSVGPTFAAKQGDENEQESTPPRVRTSEGAALKRTSHSALKDVNLEGVVKRAHTTHSLRKKKWVPQAPVVQEGLLKRWHVRAGRQPTQCKVVGTTPFLWQ